jgi:hypothetical protein
MSDEQTTSEEVAGPTPPAILIGPGSDGLFVGLVHQYGVMRSFVADGVETMWRRLESILVGEFGMKQMAAGDLASLAIKAHMTHGALSDMYGEALQEIELLRGELGQAHMKIADMSQPQVAMSAPAAEPEPVPAAPRLVVVPTQDPAVEGQG